MSTLSPLPSGIDPSDPAVGLRCGGKPDCTAFTRINGSSFGTASTLGAALAVCGWRLSVATVGRLRRLPSDGANGLVPVCGQCAGGILKGLL